MVSPEVRRVGETWHWVSLKHQIQQKQVLGRGNLPGPGKGKPRERSISVSEMDTWIRSGAEGFGGI